MNQIVKTWFYVYVCSIILYEPIWLMYYQFNTWDNRHFYGCVWVTRPFVLNANNYCRKSFKDITESEEETPHLQVIKSYLNL